MIHRRCASAVIALAVLAGCGTRMGIDNPDDMPVAEAAPTQYPLPFGLEQVQGTVAFAPPVVVEQITGYFNSQPVRVTSLRAAYRVIGPPQETMVTWSEQFAELGIGEVSVRTPAMYESDGPLPWLALSTYSASASMSWANAELWSTTGDPLLLIEIDISSGAVSIQVDTPEMAELPTPPSPMPTAVVTAGDRVFGAQGAEVHLPSGAEEVMPSVPSILGTDGEVVMLRTDDPLATVQTLVQEAYDFNEAHPQHEPGSIDGPHEAELNGSTTVTASFNSGSGGWGFTVLASQSPEDNLASVWVRTYAD